VTRESGGEGGEPLSVTAWETAGGAEGIKKTAQKQGNLRESVLNSKSSAELLENGFQLQRAGGKESFPLSPIPFPKRRERERET